MSPREGRDGETASRQEREVKLRVADAGEALQALLAAGASPEGPWQLEDDRLLDDARRSVHGADCVLRVRRIVPEGGAAPSSGLVTWKGPARIEDGARVREEVESRCEDPEAMLLALARLGYETVFRYQKERRILRLGDALVTVDRTPIGHFVEVEGDGPAIARAAAVLGRGPSDYETRSYAALWRQARPDGGDMLLDGGGR